MNKRDMIKKLTRLGLKCRFLPVFEKETGVILLKTKDTGRMKHGRFYGTEVALFPEDTRFAVLTSNLVLASKLGTEHGLLISLTTHTAEALVPAVYADAVLPKFGACVR